MEESLGKRIVANRRRLGMTQDALAEKLGVTAQAVSKWENDQSCPDIAMLPKLAEIFNITADELLGLSKKESPMAQAVEVSAPQEEVDPPQASVPDPINWDALKSPAAAFGFWLFLTGLVALVDALRLPPYDLADIGLADIAICCGIFTFGLFSVFRRFSLLRAGCTMAGGAFIFLLLTEPSIGDMDWFVPLAAGLSLFGLDLLIDTIRKPKKNSHKTGYNGHSHFSSTAEQNGPKNYCEYDGECFDCATCFGEGKHTIQLPRLSGGQAECSFGELTLDLSGCGSITDGCTLNLSCSFGELVLLVPRQYRVKDSSSCAFGSLTIDGPADPGAQITIYVNCKVSFASICVQYV